MFCCSDALELWLRLIDEGYSVSLFQAFIIGLIGAEVAVFAQLLLKSAATFEYETVLKQYLNPRVILGYGLMVLSALITVIAYRVLPLSYSPIMNALATLSLAILSWLIFKEKFTARKVLGFALIIGGILLFLVPGWRIL